jgi:hypothetical protein
MVLLDFCFKEGGKVGQRNPKRDEVGGINVIQ